MAGPAFNEGDRGKDVVTADGIRVGTVNEVDDNWASIDRSDDENEELTSKVKDMLGWDDDADEEDHRIRGEHVDRTDDDRIHLRQE